jgi:aminocarboxymuconate-semialdehyde decarboxylase
MHIIDSHFHWKPRAVYERLSKRKGYPRIAPNDRGGFTTWLKEGSPPSSNIGSNWFDLDQELKTIKNPGHEVGVVCSTGTFSVFFSQLPPEEGRDAAIHWNEEMAWAQGRYPGRVWATAAVPLTDTGMALEVLDDAVNRLGLVGVNLPGSIGSDPYIDAERLEPFYDRVEELDLPLFLHPTDAIFADLLAGYDRALHNSIGRIMEVSVAASRLIVSGIMERHPKLKIVMSHTGGTLPYQSGKMDHNVKRTKLEQPATTYIKRMYTDTVSSHKAGMKFAIEYYGVDHVMYGTDYPCLDHQKTLEYFNEIELSEEERHKILYGNARAVFNLRNPTAQPITNVGHAAKV